MKIEAIQNQNVNNKAQRAVSFGIGPSDALVQGFDAISRGGLAASFLTQDALACGFPRTISSANRNSDELGHPNWVAAMETGLRETLTGSSMFFVPALVLYFANKLTGSAVKVPVHTIKDFSDLMKEVPVGLNAEDTKKAFYTKVFERIAKNNEIKPESIPYFVDRTLEAQSAKSRGIINNMLDRAQTVPSKEEIINEIAENFAKQKKALSNDFKTEFTNATLSRNITCAKKNTIEIGTLLKSLENYTDDYTKNGLKIGLENFKNRRMGSRFIANIALTLGVGAFLAILPRIYSVSKTNPEADKRSAVAKGVKDAD